MQGKQLRSCGHVWTRGQGEGESGKVWERWISASRSNIQLSVNFIRTRITFAGRPAIKTERRWCGAMERRRVREDLYGRFYICQ